VGKSVLVFCLVAASAILSKNTIFFEGLSLGDLLFAVAIGVVVGGGLRGGAALRIDVYSVSLMAFIGFALWTGLYRTFSSPLNFSEEKFLRSALKLVFYGVGSLLVISQLRRLSPALLQSLLLWVLSVSAVVALYVYVVMTLDLPLPYEFLWYGQVDAGKDTAFYRQTEIVAAKGLFVEPSLLGLFHAFGLGCVYLMPGAAAKALGWRQLLILCSLLLSLSLTGYLLLFLVVLLLVMRSREPRSLVLAGVVIAIPVVAIVSSELLQDIIALRLANSLAGVDNSSSARVLGSWDVALKFLSEAPFVGVGLGNFDHAQYGLSSSAFDIGQGDQGWNVLAYIAGTTGLIGLCLFAVSLAAQLRGALGLALVFIAAMFTTGAFLEPMFWFFFALVAAAASHPLPVSIQPLRGGPRQLAS
jgi:O-antigen ligase